MVRGQVDSCGEVGSLCLCVLHEQLGDDDPVSLEGRYSLWLNMWEASSGWSEPYLQVVPLTHRGACYTWCGPGMHVSLLASTLSACCGGGLGCQPGLLACMLCYCRCWCRCSTRACTCWPACMHAHRPHACDNQLVGGHTRPQWVPQLVTLAGETGCRPGLD